MGSVFDDPESPCHSQLDVVDIAECIGKVDCMQPEPVIVQREEFDSAASVYRLCSWEYDSVVCLPV